MSEPIALVRPTPNAELATTLRAIADEAERGEFTRVLVVKFRADHSFSVRLVGIGSDLAAVGALEFAKRDIIEKNTPEADGGA